MPGTIKLSKNAVVFQQGAAGGQSPKRLQMDVNIDDAAFMYARACRAWYGKRATRIVRGRASELAKRGDNKGAAVWTKVADHLSRLDRPDRRHGASGGQLC
jgi:hypothetical protein